MSVKADGLPDVHKVEGENMAWMQSDPVVVFADSIFDDGELAYIGAYFYDLDLDGCIKVPGYWADIYGEDLHNVTGWAPLPAERHKV